MSAVKRSSDRYHQLDGAPDERHHQRDPAIGFTLRNPVAGQVIDISAGGFGVEGLCPLNLSDQYSFTLSIGTSRVRVRGEVRWCKLVGTSLLEKGESAPIYRVGVSFLDS
jgi:hypothetical protein